MFEGTLIALFLAGALGAPHCVGMCGGIVGALGGLSANAPAAGAKPTDPPSGDSPFFLHLGYNLGRISSYSIAGALAGGVGGALLLTGALWPRLVLLALAGLMLVAMGLYLLGLPQLVLPLEKAGGHLWRRVQPLARPFLPVRRFTQAFPLGLVWGWLPCGLVYTALTSALSAGAPWRGALVMLAFGAGTLPAMLLGGLFAGRVAGMLRHRYVRLAAGLAVAAFGIHALIGVGRLAAA